MYYDKIAYPFVFVPFLVIRCISDLASEATTEDYKKFEELADHKSDKLVKEMICHL